MSAESSVADDELAAFVDRVLRMKAEEDAIKADIREIYGEAKSRGYDKTRLGEVVAHVRKVEKDANGEAEKEAIRDLYLTAYYRSKNKPHAHAHARASKSTTRNVSVSEPFDPETGEFGTTQEITKPQAAPQPASDLTVPPSPQGQVAPIQESPRKAAEAEGESPSTQDGGAFSAVKGANARLENAVGVEPSPSTPIQPETANESLGDEDTAVRTGEAVDGDVNGAETSAEGVTGGESAATNQSGDGSGVAPKAETDKSVEPSGSAAPISFADKVKKLRPLCQSPNACRSSGGKSHCNTCTKAANADQVPA